MFKNDQEYFADTEYVSNSQLKDFDHCQYLYEGKHITKIFRDEEEHDYFTYGSAVDCLLTEPEGTFEQRFYPIDRRVDISEAETLPIIIKALQKEIAEKEVEGKAHKMLDDKLAKLNENLKRMKNLIGKTQITNTMFENITKSAEELNRQPLFKLFGLKEKGGSQEIITGEIMGLKMKGKLDYINIDKKVIADVKTVSTMERFDPMIYARQLAYYRLLASNKYSIDQQDWDCYLLVVDKGSSVKRSEIFHISKRAINQAAEELLVSLGKFKKTKEAGFYIPAPEDSEIMNGRKERCFNCPFYNQCEFSVQKEITLID